jgi:hypothetical protein
MKDKHITDILDNTPPASLNASDLETICAHVNECAACLEAYRAAQLSELLVKERASETIEPSPFFQTRVMAAWREQQASGVSVFERFWKSAGALVSSLALTTAALAALSFTIPETTNQAPADTIAAVESEVLGVGESDEQLTEEQMLSAMYVDEEVTR